MAHYIYQCIISQGAELFSGYGITENEAQRRATHAENLAEKGFVLRDWIAHQVPSKAIAAAIEKKIKDETRPIDIKVDGFRTECAPIEQHGYITLLIIKELQIASGSTTAPAEEPSEDHYSNQLSDDDLASYEANVRDWESLLETVWGGRITGETNRNTAKKFLADSLEALHANSKKVSVYLPEGATDTPDEDYEECTTGKRVRCKGFKAYNGEDILEYELNATRRALHDINWEKAQAKKNAEQKEEQLKLEKRATALAAAKRNLMAAQEPRVQEQIREISKAKDHYFERWYDAREIKTLENLVSEARAIVDAWDARDALMAAQSPKLAERVRLAIDSGHLGQTWNKPDLNKIERTIEEYSKVVEALEAADESDRKAKLAEEASVSASAPRKKVLGLF